MGAVYRPYMPDDAALIEQLRTCRTFAFPDVMARAADRLEELLQLRTPPDNNPGIDGASKGASPATGPMPVGEAPTLSEAKP